MLKFYFNGSPNPTKVALFLEESALPYEAIPVDTRKGDQFKPAFAAVNPNGKVPAIVDGDTTVFVEVKARVTAEFGTAAAAVTPVKQRRLASMAVDYLARHRLTGRPSRFDVVAIDGDGDSASITVYRSAFTTP